MIVSTLRRGGGGRGLGENDADARVLRHHRQPGRRILAQIHRDVSGAALEHRQERNRELLRPFPGRPRRSRPPDPFFSQAVRQPVRAPIEVGVRQRLGAGTNGGVLGAPGGLGGHALVHRRTGEWALGGVEVGQQLDLVGPQQARNP